MRLLSLADIQKLSVGEAIPSFHCQIKEIKPYSKGTHAQYGDWTIQNIVVMDSTGVCQVKVKNHLELGKELIQRHAVFESTINKKDGMMQGIRWKEDNYKGRVSNVIEVTGSALIDFAQVGHAEPEPQQEPTEGHPEYYPAAPPYTLQPPPPAQRPALPDTAQAILDVRERLGKAANGLIMAYDAAVYVMNSVQAKHTDVVFTPDVLEKIAVHLSIGLEKNGSVHGLPTGPLETAGKPDGGIPAARP